MLSINGTIYLCPYSCADIEDSTPDGIPDDVVYLESPVDGVGEGTLYLVSDKDYKKYAEHTLYIRRKEDNVCQSRLSWERDENTTIRLSYELPKSCDWNYTIIEPAYPPHYNRVPGAPQWSITINNGKNKVIHTISGEDKNDLFVVNDYYTLGDTIEYVYHSLFVLPGGYIQAKEYYGNGSIRIIRTPFGTPNLIGGYIVDTATVDEDGAAIDKGYVVEIFGHQRTVESADYNDYDVGDWVILSANCCPRPKDNSSRPCPAECNGEPGYIDPDGDGFYTIDTANLYGVESILGYDAKEDILRNDIDFIIIHLGIGTFGPSKTYHEYSYSALDFAYSLDTCFYSGIIVSKNDSDKTLNIDIGGSLIEHVPIKYVRKGESTFDDGYYLAYEEASVLVANLTGTNELSAEKLVVISLCNPSMPIILCWLDRWNDMCFLWDLDANSYLDGVTYDDGSPVSFPVKKSLINQWISDHLESVGTESISSYTYSSATPTVIPNGATCAAFGRCVSQTLSNVNIGPALDYYGGCQAEKSDYCGISGTSITHPNDITQYWGDCTTTGSYRGTRTKVLVLDTGATYDFISTINGNCYGDGSYSNTIKSGRRIESELTKNYYASSESYLSGVGGVTGSGSLYNHGTYEKIFGIYKEIHKESMVNEEKSYIATGIKIGGAGRRVKLLLLGTFKCEWHKNVTAWYHKIPYVGIDTDTIIEETEFSPDYNDATTSYITKIAAISDVKKDYSDIDVIADGVSSAGLEAALYSLQLSANMQISYWSDPSVLKGFGYCYIGMATLLGEMELPSIYFLDRRVL